jgi:AcrR family transcriptional regulator
MDTAPTRDKLLAAAARVFLRHGFGAASMDQVRQEAGVSNGSLYHHFPTKAQLADALYAHTLRDFHAALLEPVAGRASAQAAVKAMVRVHIDWVLRHPEAARLLQDLKRAGPLAAGAGEWAQANDQGFGALRAWVDVKVAAGEMRPLPFPVWVAVVFAPSLSLTSFWITQSSVPAKVRAALEHAAWMAVAP